jgi:hypothetical protein
MHSNVRRRASGLCWFILLVMAVASPALAQESRPFLMTAGGIQVVAGEHGAHLYRNSSPQFPLSALAADVDVVSIFPEHLGVPFRHFRWGVAPPPTDPWTKEVTALAAEAKATGKPILLQLTFVRVNLIALATNNFGVLKVESGWAESCGLAVLVGRAGLPELRDLDDRALRSRIHRHHRRTESVLRQLRRRYSVVEGSSQRGAGHLCCRETRQTGGYRVPFIQPRGDLRSGTQWI